MSSSAGRRERRLQLQLEKKLFKKEKLRIPTVHEVEEYIKAKAEENNSIKNIMKDGL